MEKIADIEDELSNLLPKIIHRFIILFMLK